MQRFTRVVVMRQRVVPLDECALLGLGQERQLAYRQLRAGSNGVEQHFEVAEEPANGVRLEQLSAVEEIAGQTFLLFPHVQLQIETSRAIIKLLLAKR